MSKKTYTIWKEEGQTPYQAIEYLREDRKLPKDLKLSFAGRLDPMAEGKLLILSAEECKNRDRYLALDKEYEFEVLLGLSTDTGDILGVVEKEIKHTVNDNYKDVVKKFLGDYSCEYPAFSSKTVANKNGEIKSLLLWALEGRLSEIEIPKKNVQIYSLEYISSKVISASELALEVPMRINRLPKVEEQSKALGNDFRRKEVLNSWKDVLIDPLGIQEFEIVKFRCIASSGAYMRTLARDIAEALDAKGLAWTIKRKKIGKYKKIFKNFGIWTKSY